MLGHSRVLVTEFDMRKGLITIFCHTRETNALENCTKGKFKIHRYLNRKERKNKPKQGNQRYNNEEEQKSHNKSSFV